MPCPNPVFKLGLDRIMPGLHLDLTKNTPGLLKYCHTLTNTTMPQTIIKFVEKTAFVPKPTFFATLSNIFWFIATWLGAALIILLVFVAIVSTCIAFSKKPPNPVPCKSLRKSIRLLHSRINQFPESDNKKKFDERYESVSHHDDWNKMKRTTTIVEHLKPVSEDKKVCPAWERKTLNKEAGGKEGDVECSDDVGLLLCCTNTPKESEFVEVAKKELI